MTGRPTNNRRSLTPFADSGRATLALGRATAAAPRRRGVTLMEVLISIGVVAIGLFGVLALIPLAGYQAQLGLIEDGKAVVGQNAFREFEIREMRRPDMWLYANGNAVRNVTTYPSSPHIPRQAFAIDPRFVAFHGAANNRPFPFPPAATITMPRITLRNSPGGGPMTLIQANTVFVSEDELVFNAPSDKTLPPVQELTTGNTKRQTLPNLSWMATLVPKAQHPTDPMPASDLYVLSIVVFYKRDQTFSMAGSASKQPANERMAIVSQFYGGGITGGDVQLSATSATAPAEDLAVKRGDWVMLTANWNVVGSTAVPIFRWYRVIAASERPDNSSGTWTRDVTLLGGDWPLSIPSAAVTQVVLMNDVVAVYEKTIRLETTSLWTN